MDILKTPQQKLLEEAGALPASPGMVNTPQQMLMQESGVLPHLAEGGIISPEAMIAELIQNGHLPEHFASGGLALNNTPGAFSLPFIGQGAGFNPPPPEVGNPTLGEYLAQMRPPLTETSFYKK